MKRRPRDLKKTKPERIGDPRLGFFRFSGARSCYGGAKAYQPIAWGIILFGACNKLKKVRPPRTLNPVARVLRRKKIAWYFGNMMAVAAQARKLAYVAANSVFAHKVLRHGAGEKVTWGRVFEIQERT